MPSLLCGQSTTAREEGLRAIALDVSGGSFGDSADDPRARAFDWLAVQDTGYLCPGGADDASIRQRYTLAVLYYSFGGDGWTQCAASLSVPCNSARFLSSKSECTWSGVTCDNTNSVSQLNLDSNNLVGTIPREIGALHRLFELDLDANGLSGPIPTNIGQLTDLVHLDLDENNLTGTIPEEIYDLTLLRGLDLDTNQLTGTLSTKIGQLPDLYIGQFDLNQLTGTIPTEIALLSSLAFFTMTGNNFTGTVPADICALQTVKFFAECNLCTTEFCCEDCD